ncbi:MAG: hypothetical protein E6Q97_28940 [Desulfurellales bacterium]|nr:MAG: hypothetical protein E6Q97_28940 [Desulfurellales bacterium]
MSQQNSASVTLRRKLNSEQLTAVAFELAALQSEDQPFPLQLSLNTEELWQLACQLRIAIRANLYRLPDKQLEKLMGIHNEILNWYRSRDAATICKILESDL